MVCRRAFVLFIIIIFSFFLYQVLIWILSPLHWLYNIGQVRKRYKIKDAALGTETPMPKQRDVRSRPLQESISTTSAETLEEAAKTAAKIIAEAENKSFLAAEAVRESERVSQMAEDAHAMFTHLKEVSEQCKSLCCFLFVIWKTKPTDLLLVMHKNLLIYFSCIRGRRDDTSSKSKHIACPCFIGKLNYYEFLYSCFFFSSWFSGSPTDCLVIVSNNREKRTSSVFRSRRRLILSTARRQRVWIY